MVKTQFFFVYACIIASVIAVVTVPTSCPPGYGLYGSDCIICTGNRYSNATMLLCQYCLSYQKPNANRSECFVPCDGECNTKQYCNSTTNTCECLEGFTGASCTGAYTCGSYDSTIFNCLAPGQLICKDETKNGTACDTCKSGRNGTNCDEFVCTDMPTNATCVAPNFYECDSGLTGVYCNETLVTSCQENAFVMDNVCTCISGYKLVDGTCIKAASDLRPKYSESFELRSIPRAVIEHNDKHYFMERCAVFNQNTDWRQDNCLTAVYSEEGLMTISGLNEYKLNLFNTSISNWTEITEFPKTILPHSGYGLHHSSKPDYIFIGGGYSGPKNTSIMKLDITDGSNTIINTTALECAGDDCYVSQYGTLFAITELSEEENPFLIDLFDVSTEQLERIDFNLNCSGGSVDLVSENDIYVLCSNTTEFILHKCSISQRSCQIQNSYLATSSAVENWLDGLLDIGDEIKVWGEYGLMILPEENSYKTDSFRTKLKMKISAYHMFEYDDELYFLKQEYPYIHKFDAVKGIVKGLYDFTFSDSVVNYTSAVDAGCASISYNRKVRVYCAHDDYWDYNVVDISFSSKSVKLNQLLPDLRPLRSLEDAAFFSNGETTYITGSAINMLDDDQKYLMSSNITSDIVTSTPTNMTFSMVGHSFLMYNNETIYSYVHGYELAFHLDGSTGLRRIPDVDLGQIFMGAFQPMDENGDRFIWYGLNFFKGLQFVVYDVENDTTSSFVMNSADDVFNYGIVFKSVFLNNTMYGLGMEFNSNSEGEMYFFAIEVLDVCGQVDGKVCNVSTGLYIESETEPEPKQNMTTLIIVGVLLILIIIATMWLNSAVGDNNKHVILEPEMNVEQMTVVSSPVNEEEKTNQV
ncbi:hypothetical protein PCE1_002054 [Barthelona sp. PCE]